VCKVYRGRVLISGLAGRVGVPVSTVRYYERIGLMAQPSRTSSGYRRHDPDAATRLLFVTRARQLGLTCDQVLELLPIWGGTECSTTHDEVERLIEEKKGEIAERIAQLATFAARLDSVHAILESRRRRTPAARTSAAACRRGRARSCRWPS
jgi:DNA-binding transcriptional MerR regulator